MTSFPYKYSSSSKGEFQKVILSETQKLLTDALANGGFKIGTSADFAIQPVPKTSDNYSIYGYYFDFVRTYHADRAERLVVLGDYLNDSQKCIRIKAGSQKSIMINPTTLLGKTLIDVQSSVHFTHN